MTFHQSSARKVDASLGSDQHFATRLHRFPELTLRRLAIFVGSIVLSSGALAAPPSRESIDTLLAVTHVEKVLDGLMVVMDRTFQTTVASAFPTQSLTPDQRSTMEAMHARTMKIIRGNLTWAKLEPLYEQVYGEVYTQEEIDGLIAFYRRPVGSAYIDKLPRATEVSMTAMQSLLQPMIEEMRTATQQTIAQMRSAPETTTH